MGSFGTKRFKGSHRVNTPEIHVKWRSLGTDLQKKWSHWVQICEKVVNEYKEAKFAQIHVINGNSLSMYQWLTLVSMSMKPGVLTI